MSGCTVWHLGGMLDFDFDEHHQTVWKVEIFCTGNLRQCMEMAVSFVPKYRGWGLTIESITQAWEELYYEETDFKWLDGKREWFFVEQVGRVHGVC